MKFLDFEVSEYQDRLARTQKTMAELGFDGLVVSDASNLIYLTGYRTILYSSKFRPFLAVVPQSGDITLVLPNLEVGIGRKGSWIEDVRGWGKGLYADAPDPFTLVGEALKEKGLAQGKIGIELGHGQRLGMNQDQWQELQSKAPNVTWANSADVMWPVRLIKSPQELDYIRTACKATDIAWTAAAEACGEGVSEREAADIIAHEMINHAEGPSFLVVASGPDRYDMINAPPSDRKMQQGDMVCFDIGADYKHYWSDLSRVLYIGEPSQRRKEFHQAELEVFWAGVKAVKPGVTCEEVDQACERKIEELGFKDYMLHRTGHALGLDVHELPSVALGDKTVLQTGMVLTIEPGLYDFSIGAWRIEDTVAVTDNGYELLTNCERDIVVR
jgi:Xaa-Pro aminopeptidase